MSYLFFSISCFARLLAVTQQSYTFQSTINTWRKQHFIQFRMYFHPKNLKTKKNQTWLKPCLIFSYSHKCRCQKIRLVFRILGMYNFVTQLKILGHFLCHFHDHERIDNNLFNYNFIWFQFHHDSWQMEPIEVCHFVIYILQKIHI